MLNGKIEKHFGGISSVFPASFPEELLPALLEKIQLNYF